LWHDMQENAKTPQIIRNRRSFGFAPEEDRKEAALLESHHRGRAIWTRKLKNNAESVALRSIQGGELTIRSKTEPESVKLVLSREADDPPSALNEWIAKRRI
jgi:hypothetical protein